MDPIIYQTLQSLSEFNKSQVTKKTLQFILSISIFSLLFSYSSWMPFFLHSFNLYSSTFSFHFEYLNYGAVDRKYVFLLCNGILVFVHLIGSSPLKTDQTHSEFSHGNRQYNCLRSQPAEFSDVNYFVEKEVAVASVGSLEKFVAEEDGEVGNELQLAEGSESEEHGSLIIIEAEEGEEKEDDGHVSLSREELNKKCEEFIQRMKEKIRIEHQQLAIV